MGQVGAVMCPMSPWREAPTWTCSKRGHKKWEAIPIQPIHQKPICNETRKFDGVKIRCRKHHKIKVAKIWKKWLQSTKRPQFPAKYNQFVEPRLCGSGMAGFQKRRAGELKIIYCMATVLLLWIDEVPCLVWLSAHHWPLIYYVGHETRGTMSKNAKRAPKTFEYVGFLGEWFASRHPVSCPICLTPLGNSKDESMRYQAPWVRLEGKVSSAFPGYLSYLVIIWQQQRKTTTFTIDPPVILIKPK